MLKRIINAIRRNNDARDEEIQRYRDALTLIAILETEKANATVKKMAAIANRVLEAEDAK